MTAPADDTRPVDTPRRRGPVGAFRARRWTVEVLLFAIALVAYQLSRTIVMGDARDAARNAWEIIGIEKAYGMFFESDVQRWALDNLHVTQFLNHFYVWAHLPVTALFFVWLFRRHKDVYPFVRNAFFVANAVALAVFVVFPVAPPRLMTNEGFVDTLSIISGIDLHAGHLSGWFNPFAAVPSMHFAYALMIGIVAAVLIRNWPLRVLMLTYPVIVFITIVGTANHYVLDAFAGGAVMCAAFGATWVWRWWRERVADRADARRLCAH
jgi:hypothetical protein